MLPIQFAEEFEALKPHRPSNEVRARVVTIRTNIYGNKVAEELESVVTNIVLGPKGIEIVCEPI